MSTGVVGVASPGEDAGEMGDIGGVGKLESAEAERRGREKKPLNDLAARVAIEGRIGLSVDGVFKSSSSESLEALELPEVELDDIRRTASIF
jgi:hypothetical protein